MKSTGAQVQVICASSFAASLMDQILTCPCREGTALHFLPNFLPYPERGRIDIRFSGQVLFSPEALGFSLTGGQPR